MNIQQIIDEIISDFKAGKDITAKLRILNADSLSFTEWVYENQTDDQIYGDVFILSKEEMFERFQENFFDGLSEQDPSKKAERIWEFFLDQFDFAEDVSLTFMHLSGIVLCFEGHPIGKAGLEFSGVGVFNSQDEAIKNYLVAGFYITDGQHTFHSKKEVLATFTQ